MLACTGFVTGFSAVFVLLGVGAVSLGRVVRTWSVEVFGFQLGFASAARSSSGARRFTRIFDSKSSPADQPRYSWLGRAKQ